MAELVEAELWSCMFVPLWGKVSTPPCYFGCLIVAFSSGLPECASWRLDSQPKAACFIDDQIFDHAWRRFEAHFHRDDCGITNSPT